jgi:hypothetical protein
MRESGGGRWEAAGGTAWRWKAFAHKLEGVYVVEN